MVATIWKKSQTPLRCTPAITDLFHAQTQKTVRQRFAELMEMRSGYVTHTPEIACVFDSLERHFPKLVNAIESPGHSPHEQCHRIGDPAVRPALPINVRAR